MSQLSYDKIAMVQPPFDSPVTDLIIELDHLRRKRLGGSTTPVVFFQLKNIFHKLESLESARIEGNRTTLSELVEKQIGGKKTSTESLKEIQNVELAMNFIGQNVPTSPINRIMLSEIHRLVVKGLSSEKEGDFHPGEYRKSAIKIAKSPHVPPEYINVPDLMDELFEFINDDSASKYDLLKTALIHHRFVWIHPFSNGNGRTVRLLTYAMLIKQGFNVNVDRILNPTAIFCNDRQQYYDQLSLANSGSNAALVKWCEYVLSGLKVEIEKIDRLLDYAFLSEQILMPGLKSALDPKLITHLEEKILRVAVQKQIFQASDVRAVLPGKIPSEISRLLKGLKRKKNDSSD